MNPGPAYHQFFKWLPLETDILYDKASRSDLDSSIRPLFIDSDRKVKDVAKILARTSQIFFTVTSD